MVHFHNVDVGVRKKLRGLYDEIQQHVDARGKVGGQNDGRSLGVFTDGDLRRLLLRSQKPLSALFADDIINYARTEFMSVDRHTGIAEALSLLQEREIFDLPVLSPDGKLEGVIHLHPALRVLLKSESA